MSYTPTTWTSGDVITAEKLNNLEGGVEAAGSALLITITSGDNSMATMDKAWKEIYDAFMGGIPCIATYDQSYSTHNYLVTDVYTQGESYEVTVGDYSYYTNSENDYPQYSFD